MGHYDENGDFKGPLDRYSEIKTCIGCRREYRSVMEEQIIGFRQKDLDNCPYCGYTNGFSINWNFYNSRME